MRRAIRILLIMTVAASAVVVVIRGPESALSLLHSTFRPWDGPPPGLGELDRRILPAVRVPGVKRTSGFMNVHPDGTPVTFSPCRPWPVVVNVRKGPRGAAGVVADAVAQIQEATGVRFVVEGRTDERVRIDRPNYQPERYGDRWAPLLVGWAPTRGDLPAGRGGPGLAERMLGQAQYVTGVVQIDPSAGFNADSGTLRALLLHELGHVVGLAHSDDPRSLMYPTNHGQLDFTAADRAGLARLGRGDCSSSY